MGKKEKREREKGSGSEKSTCRKGWDYEAKGKKCTGKGLYGSKVAAGLLSATWKQGW